MNSGADVFRWRVVGLGEVLWDCFPDGTRQLGGAPANFAFHCSQLGAEACVVSAVGRDAPGREILRRFRRWGLPPHTVAVLPRRATGRVEVALDAAGVPQFTICTGVAWDAIPWRRELAPVARRADAVCFGSLAQRSAAAATTVRRFLDATRPECLRVCDINLRQAWYDAATVRASLTRATVLKLNDGELPVLARLLRTPHTSTEEQVRWLLRRHGLRLVALTCGARGSLLAAAGARGDAVFHWQPGFRVRVVDTVGAGDAFTAVLVLGLLDGQPLPALNRRAAQVAAFVCTRAGATPALPARLPRFRGGGAAASVCV